MAELKLDDILDQLEIGGKSQFSRSEIEKLWSLCLMLQKGLEEQLLQSQSMLELGYQEMQKMWHSVQQKDKLAKAIFDASRDMILTLDGLGQIIEYNQAFVEILKLQNGEVLGRHIASVVPNGTLIDDLRIFFSGNNDKFKQSFLRSQLEKTLIDSGGGLVEVSVFVSPVETGSSFVYALYIKDLRGEKAAARALEESRIQILSASKMSALGEMAGGVAHEINTPLAIIQMRADQLVDGLAEDPIDKELFKSALTAITQTVKRISKIVYGLRSFARDGSQDEMILYPVSKIVEDTFSLCRERFTSHGVHLEYVAGRDEMVNCRPGEITQVLLNLINNAYDAIHAEPDPWVKVALVSKDNFIELRVSDCGAGIPLDIQEKMMHPFFTTKEIGKGTGLGLSISRGIVQAHGGRMTIDNSCAHTTFCIELPRSK